MAKATEKTITIIEQAELEGTAPIDGYYGYIIGTGQPGRLKSPHSWFRDRDVAHAKAWASISNNRVIIHLSQGDAVFWHDYQILQFAE